MRRAALALALALALSLAAPGAGAQVEQAPAQRFLLIVQGLGGEPFYAEVFQRWAQSLREIAQLQLGFAPRDIVYLAPDGPAPAPAGAGTAPATAADGLSRKARVVQALEAFGARGSAGDLLVIVLIGHGTARDGRAHFNLPGPDLEAAELAGLLAPMPFARLLVVNTTSASGPFAQALAAPGRIIITATASGAEINHAHFGGHFVQALVDPGADTDKDGRISVLEAFELARRRVADAYAADQRLVTEHALLEDDADGVGTRTPARDSGDGVLAGTVYLQREDTGGHDPAAAERLALEVQARELVSRIARLKRSRDLLRPREFDTRLEELLITLAHNRRALRSAGPR